MTGASSLRADRATVVEPVPVSPLRDGIPSAGLVLSLFPGIGLLDQAFEEAGFTVVRGPDLLWGGDICNFHVPEGRFDGIIGGPPCQRFSGLGNVNRARWGDDSVMPDRIPEFARCVNEAQPAWFLMENVPAAPVPDCPGYKLTQRLCDNRWCGGEQRRRRRFTFGCRVPATPFHIEGVALETSTELPTVVSTGQADWKGSAERNRASVRYMAEAQGIDPSRFDKTPFTITELRRAIANGVPLPMGRAVAQAVLASVAPLRSAAAERRMTDACSHSLAFWAGLVRCCPDCGAKAGFESAKGIEAGTDETPQAAQPEGREPGGEAIRPNTSPLLTPQRKTGQ